MIYFKISNAIADPENLDIDNILNSLNSIEQILVVKIGYTDDDLKIAKKRDSVYKTENPGIIHYKYILGGTREDERLIHKYLKEHLYAGREWFRLTPEVINFVESINTLDDLRTELSDLRDSIEIANDYKEKSQVLNKLIPAILAACYSDLEGLDYYNKYYEISLNTRIVEYCSDDYEIKILDYIKDNYPNHESIVEKYKQNRDVCNKELENQYNLLTNFVDKMKFLCESVKRGVDFESIRYFIDDDVVNFYLVLGVDKIESHSYIRIRLDRVISDRMNNQTIDVSSEVYNSFIVGERYNKPFIKSELGRIYELLNYKKTPKATDLEEWFEIRYVKYTENGRKINGFEIVRKKL